MWTKRRNGYISPFKDFRPGGAVRAQGDEGRRSLTLFLGQVVGPGPEVVSKWAHAKAEISTFSAENVNVQEGIISKLISF